MMVVVVFGKPKSLPKEREKKHIVHLSNWKLEQIYESIVDLSKVLLFISLIIPPILDITHSVHYHIRINHYIIYYFKRVFNLKDIQPQKESIITHSHLLYIHIYSIKLL